MTITLIDNTPMMSPAAMLSLLEELVAIKSVSNKPMLNKKVQTIIAKLLKQAGMKVKLIPSRSKNYGPLLVAEHAGEKAQVVTLLAHSDVVDAGRDFVGFNLKKSNRSAMGPGVIDCKGGVVIAIAALMAFIKKNPKHRYTLRFICSPNEEIGSTTFHTHLVQYGKESKILLSFEPGFPNGDYINSRSGNRWYSLEIKGRAAHSGRQFHHGVNALTAMSHKLHAISQLTNIDEGTTVSPTYIESSGCCYNSVPAYCKAYLDTRFTSNDAGDRLHEDILYLCRQVDVTAYSDFKAAELSISIDDYSPALPHNDLHPEVGEKFSYYLKRYGRSGVQGRTSYGSADCNLMMAPGVIFLGGMGAVGSGQHTDKETIQVASLNRRAKATLGMLYFFNETDDLNEL